MKHRIWTGIIVTTVFVATQVGTARAAEESAAPEARSERAALRERLKDLSPEERGVALQEWRAKHPEAAARREHLRKERREASPEEREVRRQERRARLEARVAELGKKKADGTITETEARRLERLERHQKGGVPGRGEGKPPRRKESPGSKPSEGGTTGE